MDRAVESNQAEPRLFAGRYALETLIASGGMGDVWRARHVGLDREVAIKLLRDSVADGQERLLIEARTLAKLRHPSIVEVLDCGFDENDTPYIVMELLEGSTLAANLARSGPLGAVGAVGLLLPVLSGLSAVHAAGAIHRDLKPENIVLTRAGESNQFTPKLIDFGIARWDSKTLSRLTETGTFVGTPQYMAPEQLLGSAGDVKSDVWGITAVLYEAMSGVPPFNASQLADVFRAIAYEPPPFPAQVRDLDGALWAILTRGLRKQPDERFSSCAELAEALSAWLAKPGRSAQTSEPQSGGPLTRRGSFVTGATLEAGEAPLDVLIRAKKSGP